MSEETTVKLYGRVQRIDSNRSVFLGRMEDDDTCFVKFTNDKLITKLRISDEAMQALISLYYEGRSLDSTEIIIKESKQFHWTGEWKPVGVKQETAP